MTTTYIGNYFEWTGGTSTMKRYYYAGGVRVAMRTGTAEPKWLLGDHLGSQSYTVSYAGTSEEGEVRYKPWGEDRYTSGTTPTSFRYTGQRNEAALGIYYYGARWYDPSLGRFLQADTLVPNPNNPQDWDRYSYTRNNPLKYTDPTGHATLPAIHDSYGDAECSDLKRCLDASGNFIKDENTTEQLVRMEIDRLFDPFLGALPDSFQYIGSDAQKLNEQARKAYVMRGFDLDEIGRSGINNPMTEEDWLESGVPIDWIYHHGNTMAHGPFFFFIKQMRLDLNNVYNFEPNYLNVMMEYHPRELNEAKNNYYSALIAIYETPELVYEWLLMTKELGGPGID